MEVQFDWKLKNGVDCTVTATGKIVSEEINGTYVDDIKLTFTFDSDTVTLDTLEQCSYESYRIEEYASDTIFAQREAS